MFEIISTTIRMWTSYFKIIWKANRTWTAHFWSYFKNQRFGIPNPVDLLKKVIPRAPERFQKWEFDTMLPRMSPEGLVHLKGAQIYLFMSFKGSKGVLRGWYNIYIYNPINPMGCIYTGHHHNHNWTMGASQGFLTPCTIDNNALPKLVCLVTGPSYWSIGKYG